MRKLRDILIKLSRAWMYGRFLPKGLIVWVIYLLLRGGISIVGPHISMKGTIVDLLVCGIIVKWTVIASRMVDKKLLTEEFMDNI